MTITLNPHTEERLRAIAAQRNLSVEEVIDLMVAGELEDREEPVAGKHGKTLFELAAPLRGLFTDEEVDQLFARDRSTIRSTNLG